MRRLILAALLVLLAAPLALSQPQVVAVGGGRMIAGSNTTPAIDDTITSQNALTAAQQAVPAFMQFTAESTGYFSTGGYHDVVVYMRCIATGASADTTTKYSYAIGVKCSPTDGSTTQPDSLSVPPWLPETSAGFGASQPPAGSGPGAWPGEIVENFDPWIGHNLATNGRSNQFFGYGGRFISLTQRFGGSVMGCLAMQIRVRCINGNATVGNKARFQLWVFGKN